MNYRIEKTLTNNFRFRKGWFGRLIPQVEVRQDYYRPYQSPPPSVVGKAAVEAYRRNQYLGHKMVWRDATWGDVSLIKKVT